VTLPTVDLDGDSRRALEFDTLLDRIAGYACTVSGAAAVQAIQPLARLADVRDELSAVGEAGRYMDEAGRLVPARSPDPNQSLGLLAIEGVRLEPKMLRELAVVLEVAATIRTGLIVLDPDGFPYLTGLGRSIPDLRRLSAVLLRCIDSDGHISDDASSELRSIRRTHGRLGERLQAVLLGIMRGPLTRPLIQEEFITQRGGRYVIPLKANAPRNMQGIVHATSSSGATRFIEPLESIEMNNDLVRLSEEERIEEDRILQQWTLELRGCLNEVTLAVETLTRLDGLQARVLFGRECQAIIPEVTDQPLVVFNEVRHPLLDLQLRAENAVCIPLTLGLDPSDRTLVLSGPNTGGKTVALKTVGLAVLMTQAGIPVPAVRLTLPIYRQIRADIGDHQSIQANLSTFSGHIGAVAGFIDDAAPPALFLIDEIGGGTEPAEGAALAQSILDTLLEPGMTVMVTTHQDALKAWAVTTDRAVTAAMEFDPERLQPTYRIIMGATGVSAGLDIAARLGLHASIVDAARDKLGGDNQIGKHYADRLRELTSEVEHRTAGLVQQELELTELKRTLESRARQHEDRLRRDVSAGLDRAMKDVRSALKQELSHFRNERQRTVAQRELNKVERRLEMERARHHAELAPGHDDFAPGEWFVPTELQPGLVVFVRSLAREGEVLALHGERVEVRLGTMTFTVERSDLRIRKTTPGGSPPESPKPREVPKREPRSVLPASAPRELKLLGLRVDEALEAVDRYLDAALLAGHQEVRLIHGFGTGRLRKAVREFLDGHRNVKRHRSGGTGEGGDGATVVTLN
jgi:DNA mismatch repair protein MutS2